MPHLTVIGSSNADLVARVDRLPGPGETVTGGAYAEALGGKGANQAVAAARAAGPGTTVGFVACVGNDAFGTRMREAFAAEGIDTSCVRTTREARTGTALILVDASAENSIAVCAGANAELGPEDLDAAEPAIAHSAMLLLQMEVPAATVSAALERAQARGVKVLLNFAPVTGDGPPLSDRIDLLVVNETEAAQLVGEDAPAPGERVSAAGALRLARSLRGRGPRTVIVTLGSAGSVAVDEEGREHEAPAAAANPMDTTAAGDTFCGALAVALVEGRGLPAAMAFASAAGALAIEAAGAQPSIPHRAAIEARAAAAARRGP